MKGAKQRQLEQGGDIDGDLLSSSEQKEVCLVITEQRIIWLGSVELETISGAVIAAVWPDLKYPLMWVDQLRTE